MPTHTIEVTFNGELVKMPKNNHHLQKRTRIVIRRENT